MSQDARVETFVTAFEALRAEVEKVIVGHREIITHVLTSMFAGGHTLQQDVTAGKHARQDVGDDLAMADDDLLDLRPKRLERGDERLHASVLTHRALLSRTIIRVALPMRIRKSPETTVKPARRPPLAPPPLLIVTPRPVQCARHFLLRALAEQVTVAFDLAPGP